MATILLSQRKARKSKGSHSVLCRCFSPLGLGLPATFTTKCLPRSVSVVAQTLNC